MGAREEKKHPLADWQPSCSVSADRWLEEFNNAQSVVHKLGLLQFGMDLEFRYGGWTDVVKSYFAVAEGHTGNLRILNSSPKDDYRRETPFGEKKLGEMPYIVARKAFEVICLRLLKNTEKSEFGAPSWASLASDEEMFNLILHFFRLKDLTGDWPRFVNLKYFGRRDTGHDHHTLIAVNFLEELINVIWPINERCPSWWHEDTMWMFKQQRQKMIEIIYGLGRFPLLMKRADQLNAGNMAWLKKMALEEGRTSRIEESAWRGSETARLWIVLNILREEGKRQQEIQQAERLAKEAEGALKRLKA